MCGRPCQLPTKYSVLPSKKIPNFVWTSEKHISLCNFETKAGHVISFQPIRCNQTLVGGISRKLIIFLKKKKKQGADFFFFFFTFLPQEQSRQVTLRGTPVTLPPQKGQSHTKVGRTKKSKEGGFLTTSWSCYIFSLQPSARIEFKPI